MTRGSFFPSRRAAAALFAASLVFSACSGSTPAASTAAGASVAPSAGSAAVTPPVGGGTHIAVELTNAGCAPTPATIPSGPVTFDITNKNADLVIEFEVRQGDKILGEKENMAPGLNTTLFLELPAGAYVLHCPDATADSPLTVTAASAGASATAGPLAALNQKAVDGYAGYIKDQTAQLVTATDAFVAAVKAGDVAQSKALYGPARVFYERIEPVAESFGDLDPDIDARIADVADPTTWTGFHKIEQALWVANTAAGMGPIADKLSADVHKLQTLVATETYQPAQLANGASELLDEVAKSKITGEEEAYSHIDLLDFAANIEGARAAYTFLAPSLQQVDATLAATIDKRFTDVEAGLAAQKKGSDYVLYTAVSPADIRSLATAVDALAEPLAQVAAKICSC